MPFWWRWWTVGRFSRGGRPLLSSLFCGGGRVWSKLCVWGRRWGASGNYGKMRGCTWLFRRWKSLRLWAPLRTAPFSGAASQPWPRARARLWPGTVRGTGSNHHASSKADSLGEAPLLNCVIGGFRCAFPQRRCWCLIGCPSWILIISICKLTSFYNLSSARHVSPALVTPSIHSNHLPFCPPLPSPSFHTNVISILVHLGTKVFHCYGETRC